MERLTFEGNFCDIAMCAEAPGGTFCEDGCCTQRRVWERLKMYEDADAEGRLFVIPSDDAFELVWDAGERCDLCCPPCDEDEEPCDVCDKGVRYIYRRKCTVKDIPEIGKSVFLTREEAEAALVADTNVGGKGGEGDA